MTPIDGASIFLNDQKFLSFCSHDYLGLSDHPEVKKNAVKFLLQYGMSATSFEDLSFILNYQKQLEEKFARFLGKETVFFFSSPPDVHSLLKGKNIVSAESIHSLGGNFSDLRQLVEIAEKTRSLLCVDDSHALALFGKDGMGICAHRHEIDVIVGSFNKGCGVFGYFLACDEKIAHFIQHKDHFPSAVIGALDAVFELVPQMEGERKQLQQRAHFLRKELQELGLDPIPSTSPLIALPFSSKEEAEALRKSLLEAKILVAAPKPLKDTFLLQFTLTSAHMPDHLALLINSIKAWQEALVAN